MTLFYRVSSGSGKGGGSGQGGRARGVGPGGRIRGLAVKEVGLVGSGQGVGSGGTRHLIELYIIIESGSWAMGEAREKEEGV